MSLWPIGSSLREAIDVGEHNISSLCRWQRKISRAGNYHYDHHYQPPTSAVTTIFNPSPLSACCSALFSVCCSFARLDFEIQLLLHPIRPAVQARVTLFNEQLLLAHCRLSCVPKISFDSSPGPPSMSHADAFRPSFCTSFYFLALFSFHLKEAVRLSCNAISRT